MKDELNPIVMIEEAQEKAPANQEARVKAILERDYDEFKRIRDFVVKNMHKLKGKYVPLEVMAIQNITSHHCIIINDHFLFPYHEVADFIMELECQDEDKRPQKNMKLLETSSLT